MKQQIMTKPISAKVLFMQQKLQLVHLHFLFFLQVKNNK